MSQWSGMVPLHMSLVLARHRQSIVPGSHRPAMRRYPKSGIPTLRYIHWKVRNKINKLALTEQINGPLSALRGVNSTQILDNLFPSNYRMVYTRLRVGKKACTSYITSFRSCSIHKSHLISRGQYNEIRANQFNGNPKIQRAVVASQWIPWSYTLQCSHSPHYVCKSYEPYTSTIEAFAPDR